MQVHDGSCKSDKGFRVTADEFRWVDADSAVVNPSLPLDIFLPPEDYPEIHFLATKDQNGFNAGMLMMKVHKWSLKLLADALNLQTGNEDVEKLFAEQTALYVLFNQTENQHHVLYQPRPWFNTYEFHHDYEGTRGYMFVHFVGLLEERWTHMQKWLDVLEGPRQTEWEVELKDTHYPDTIEKFWTMIRHGRDAVRQVKMRYPDMETMPEPIRGSLERLQTVLWCETDQIDAVRSATQDLRDAVRNFTRPDR
jgi:lipopolysaccharide biosynthesis glycosyltransferase